MFLQFFEISNKNKSTDKATVRREIACSGSVQYACIQLQIGFETGIRVGTYLTIMYFAYSLIKNFRTIIFKSGLLSKLSQPVFLTCFFIFKRFEPHVSYKKACTVRKCNLGTGH